MSEDETKTYETLERIKDAKQGAFGGLDPRLTGQENPQNVKTESDEIHIKPVIISSPRSKPRLEKAKEVSTSFDQRKNDDLLLKEPKFKIEEPKLQVYGTSSQRQVTRTDDTPNSLFSKRFSASNDVPSFS